MYSLAGLQTAAIVYMSEFHCTSNRPLFLTLTAMFLPLGTAYQPMLAYFVLTQQFDVPVPFWPGLHFTPWRFYILISTAIVVFTLLAMCRLPESPSFLLLMGRKQEALKVLRRVYVCNTGAVAEVFVILFVNQCSGILSEKVRLFQ